MKLNLNLLRFFMAAMGGQDDGAEHYCGKAFFAEGKPV